jgi:beta-phosphoglucomutase-like phosphatase (HAD superfamily)
MTRGLLALRGIVEPNAPLDHPVVREVAEAKQLEYAKLIKDGIPPLPGMVGVVRWAQMRLHHPHAQGRLAQVSTSPLKELRPFAVQNRLDFDITIAKGDVGNRLKPDPYAYELAAKQMGIDPGEAIAIEDSIGGLQSAKAAGYFAVGLALSNEDLGNTADTVVSSPYELQAQLAMLLIA